MADPIWLADALRAEGVATVEFGDWKNIGHGDFGGIWGVVAHHTGGNSSANAIQNHPDLGLCSQIFLNRAGVAHVVGAGLAWHAGSGSYPGIANNNANAVTIGIEAENNGTEGWSSAQYWAYVKVCAAICRRLGVGSGRVIGHKEWAGAAQGKWDPGGMDMGKFRADIQNQINGGSKPAPVENQIDRVAGFSAWLGKRLHTGEKPCKDGAGRFADFEHGSIYWHPKTGALPVPTNVYERWATAKWEQGVLGYPTRFHAVVPNVGDVQAFQGGIIYRKYGTPGYIVGGVIGARWFKEGAERSDLGWPTSDEYAVGTGRRQDYERGSLEWDPSGAIKILNK